MISTPAEEVKNRLDIVQVVGEYLKLQKAGANWRALCPFHSEKGPSFFVSPARQMYHCFGCSVSGDVFSFVMQIEGIEFGDALRLLAQKAGVELPKRDPRHAKIQSERRRLQELSEAAAKFFEKQLESGPGREAKAYMEQRGVNGESFAIWRIGYAPDTRRSLIDYLIKQGYGEREIAQAGLMVRTDKGPIDRFRSRIMFPVFSVQGEVIGFGGRIFNKEGQDLAKYVNVPSTPLYDKSSVLYGLNEAKLETRRQDTCILVEGYMDVILASQSGTKNVVATSGTALTPSHLRLLKRYSENLLLAFDMDVAGDTATKRGIELALSQGFSIKIVRLEGGKDPADIARESPQAWKDALLKGSSIFDYYFDSTFERFDRKSPEGKKGAAAILLPVIAKLPNRIEQTHWVQRLADELGVKEEAAWEELRKVQAQEPRERQEAVGAETPQEKKGRRGLVEERIIALIFKRSENLKRMKEEDIKHMSLKTQEVVLGLQKAENLELSSLEKVFPRETFEQVKQAALLADLEDGEEFEDEFALCLKSLITLALKERLEEIVREIREAEGANEEAKLSLLLQEFHEITKELSN